MSTKHDLIDVKMRIYGEYLSGLDRKHLMYEWYDSCDTGTEHDRERVENSPDTTIIDELVINMEYVLQRTPDYEHIITWSYLNNSN